MQDWASSRALPDPLSRTPHQTQGGRKGEPLQSPLRQLRGHLPRERGTKPYTPTVNTLSDGLGRFMPIEGANIAPD
jgi:hypothetical protein